MVSQKSCFTNLKHQGIHSKWGNTKYWNSSRMSYRTQKKTGRGSGGEEALPMMLLKHPLGREWVQVLATVQYKFSRFESACVLIPWSIASSIRISQTSKLSYFPNLGEPNHRIKPHKMELEQICKGKIGKRNVMQRVSLVEKL